MWDVWGGEMVGKLGPMRKNERKVFESLIDFGN